MRIRDVVQVSSNDGAVPDGNIGAHPHITDDGGVGSNEYVSLAADIEVI